MFDALANLAARVVPRLIRESNKALILNLVRQHCTISRADIARRACLSRSTVSTIVGELIDEGWLVESGTGKSKGGRRPILLGFNYQAGYVLGIDAGATHLKSVATDLDGQIVTEVGRPFDVASGPEVGLSTMIDLGVRCWPRLRSTSHDSSASAWARLCARRVKALRLYRRR